MYETLEDATDQLSHCSSYDDLSDKSERQAEQGHLDQENDFNHNVTDNEFQVVRSKQRKKTQKFSELCEYRSHCKSGLNCTHRHTKAEKIYFKNPFKHKECKYKTSCWSGPTNCKFAHSDKDSFCRLCHNWSHLREKCPKQPRVQSPSTTKWIDLPVFSDWQFGKRETEPYFTMAITIWLILSLPKGSQK